MVVVPRQGIVERSERRIRPLHNSSGFRLIVAYRLFHVERVRNNSRRAREDMVAYFVLFVDDTASNGLISDFLFEGLKPCAMYSILVGK